MKFESSTCIGLYLTIRYADIMLMMMIELSNYILNTKHDNEVYKHFKAKNIFFPFSFTVQQILLSSIAWH